MVAQELKAQFDAARARYGEDRAELERLTIRMAIETLLEVLPGATTIVALGDVDEDWIPRLRTQRVLASDGSVLFDIDVGDTSRAVEDAIDYVDIELLDVLADVDAETYSGEVEIIG